MPGPSIVISFIIAGVGCVFAGLCYSEFASMIPASGSAYTYAYATLGKLAGWIIGWDLMLEYLAGASTVAVGWAGYFKSLLAAFGLHIPAALSAAPWSVDEAGHFVSTGAIINLPAPCLSSPCRCLLIVGIRSSATFNNVMVLIKLAIVLAVIGFGLPLITHANLTPFIPPSEGGGSLWLGRHHARRGRDLLCLYRFRHRFGCGPRSQKSAARFADRYSWLAAHLHRPLHPHVADHDGHCSVQGSQCAQSGGVYRRHVRASLG